MLSKLVLPGGSGVHAQGQVVTMLIPCKRRQLLQIRTSAMPPGKAMAWMRTTAESFCKNEIREADLYRVRDQAVEASL